MRLAVMKNDASPASTKFCVSHYDRSRIFKSTQMQHELGVSQHVLCTVEKTPLCIVGVIMQENIVYPGRISNVAVRETQEMISKGAIKNIAMKPPMNKFLFNLAVCPRLGNFKVRWTWTS